MPFGLNLDTKEVDAFLIEKLQKKLKYWSILHLPLVGRAIVINLCWHPHYGFSLRFGTKKVIKKCKILLRNFLWVEVSSCKNKGQLGGLMCTLKHWKVGFN
jgi:hypothetical protein